MPDTLPTADALSREQSLKNIAIAGYALQAAFFISGISAIVAIVLAYIKRDDARGTWLESHFRWQIRTFWFSLLWGAIGAITFILIIGWFILAADCIWVIYRVVKGWIRLNEGKEMLPS